MLPQSMSLGKGRRDGCGSGSGCVAHEHWEHPENHGFSNFDTSKEGLSTYKIK